ncbi:MAG: hypothetical protein LBO72_10200 [Helicobacteraceae bacterium]|jgi:hypothetical protein|nr:hypothetical protein [Helicobacteraceae bacterium]
MSDTENYKHQEKRVNIPPVEAQPVMPPKDKEPISVIYKRRNADLDPQLFWRGKDGKDWSEIVLQAPPLFVRFGLRIIQGKIANFRRAVAPVVSLNRTTPKRSAAS